MPDPRPKFDPQAKYDRANTTMIAVKLNRKTDADILAKLDAVGNRQGYIKRLIRSDISKNAPTA